MKNKLYQLYFYVPVKHVEKVKAAIFAAGAGRIGNYNCCSWQTKGEGQFLPLAGSCPAIGKKNRLSKVKEYKVETICSKKSLPKVLEALKKSHPYEEPAYGIIELM